MTSTLADFAENEIRRIVRVMKQWASLYFLDDMVKACRLVSRDNELVAATIKEIFNLAKANVLASPQTKDGIDFSSSIQIIIFIYLFFTLLLTI